MKKNDPSKQLHSDLITDNILPLLPPKSLIRFTSACKAWYHLIKSPKFISNHLNIHKTNDNVQQLLFLATNLCYVLENKELVPYANLECSVWYLAFWNTPVAACNGLLFIPGKKDNGEYFEREYFLWNPCIKKTKVVESKVEDRYHDLEGYSMFNHESFGLGYHESTCDHRIVRIVYVIDDPLKGVGHVPTEVDVYSLSTDSWHKVDSNPGKLVGFGGSCYVNGAVHWLATTKFTMITMTPDDDCLESISVFDLQNETFTEMPLPADLQVYQLDGVVVFKEYKGTLAILLSEMQEDCLVSFLWVMTDYGDITSWTNQYTLISDEHPITRWASAVLKNGILVYYEQNEEQDEEKNMVWFDVDKGQAVKTFDNWTYSYSDVLDFVNSLVLF